VQTVELSTEQSLDEIEQAVASLDEDFRPAGSIGPEVELSFEPDPFVEPFDEEEVVLDRYATWDTSLWSNRPHVSAPESEELCELLSQFTQMLVEPVEPAACELTTPWSSLGVGQQEPDAVAANYLPAGSAADGDFLACLADDESNVLLIDDEPAHPTVRLVAPQRFRQLFTNLIPERRGKDA
jgi:hypothetical protein